MATAPVSTTAPDSSRTTPRRWPVFGSLFHGRSGIVAGHAKTGTGFVAGFSNHVAPSTDRPVTRPEAKSANVLTPVFWPGGTESGLAATATLLVASEKRFTPMFRFPSAEGSSA